MKQALENATDEDRAALNEMLDDLNGLLDARTRGEDTQEQFDDFMAKHGDYFPEQPAHARRAARLPGAAGGRRAADAQLDDAGAARRARRARAAGVRLAGPDERRCASSTTTCGPLRPGEDWGGSERMDGENGLGLGDGTGVFQDLADLDALAEQLAQSYEGSQLDDLDLDKLARQLGHDAAVDARTLQRLEKALRESGTMRRGSDGQLALTPKAMRQLGKAVLRDGRRHDVRPPGRPRRPPVRRRRRAVGGHPAVGVRRHRAVGRDAARSPTRCARGGSGATGVRIEVDDVEVQETEARTQACVALLVDTSFSMAMEGRWVPMKRTALALHTLVTSRFRGDDLQLIGFGRHARGHADRAAGRARREVGEGHQPAPRAPAGQPALPQAPERPAGAAHRHRRRADLPPGARAARSSSTTRRTR